MRVDLDEVERSLDRTIYLNVPVTQQMIHELRLLRHLEEEIRSTGHEDLTPTTGAVLGTLEQMG